MRRTKEELAIAKRDKSIVAMIAANKFLRESKYQKNNYWSMAARDSWAAKGQAGGCATCSERHWNGTLHNTRAANKFCNEVSRHFCYTCITEIEKKLNINLPRH